MIKDGNMQAFDSHLASDPVLYVHVPSLPSYVGMIAGGSVPLKATDHQKKDPGFDNVT